MALSEMDYMNVGGSTPILVRVNVTGKNGVSPLYIKVDNCTDGTNILSETKAGSVETFNVNTSFTVNDVEIGLNLVSTGYSSGSIVYTFTINGESTVVNVSCGRKDITYSVNAFIVFNGKEIITGDNTSQV